MEYRIFLRLKMQDETWVTMGATHTIDWNLRELIEKSSSWTLINEENLGSANEFIAILQKGILELTQFPDNYKSYNTPSETKNVEDVLNFYHELLADCQRYPYAEIYGELKA